MRCAHSNLLKLIEYTPDDFMAVLYENWLCAYKCRLVLALQGFHAIMLTWHELGDPVYCLESQAAPP